MKNMFSRENRHFWLLSSCLIVFIAQGCQKINEADSESQLAAPTHAQSSAKN